MALITGAPSESAAHEPATHEPVLRVQSLGYCHPGSSTPVFSDISFALDSRQVLCLLGPNGVGKTTLLRCVAGLANASTGHITLSSQSHANPRQRAQRMAYVPQSTRPCAISALDMVLIGRTPWLSAFAMPAAHDLHIARAMLRKVGMEHVQDAPFDRLSGGQRQLVVIARALAQEPTLLVMDEPATSLDLGNQAKVLALIHSLCEEGMAVLMSTHQPEHAWLLHADVAILDNSALVAIGPAETVLDETRLTALYGCPMEISRAQGKPRACTPKGLLS